MLFCIFIFIQINEYANKQKIFSAQRCAGVRYAYFELKNLDWDFIVQQYRAKLYTELSSDSLFNVLSDLLFELKDDHVNLVSPFNVSVYNVEFKYPPNYFRRTVSDYYLNQQINYTGAFTHGFLPNKVAGYVRYSSFMNMVNIDDWVKILKMYENTNGLVLDIRENGGGVVLNIPAILLYLPSCLETVQTRFIFSIKAMLCTTLSGDFLSWKFLINFPTNRLIIFTKF